MSTRHAFKSTNPDKALRTAVRAAIGGVALLGCTLNVNAAALVNEPAVEAAVEVSDTAIRDSGLQSVIRNKSERRIDAVNLIVRYDWIWKDERNPGDNNPGWVEFVTLNEDLQPGDTTTFTYNPKRELPQRDDGSFMPSVQVVGFTPYETQ